MKSNVSMRRRLIDGKALLSRLPAKLGRAGAVAIITAVAAPALVMIVGFACDYGYASYINQRLARATDSGTLGSVSQTAATTAGGYTATDAMQAIGVNIFNANIADLSMTGMKFNLSVVSDGSGGVIATGSYAYSLPTFFGGVLGFTNIALSGTAKTTARPVTYVNYYIIVDTSQSMGIAATQTDMHTLYNRVVTYKNATTTEPGCVFGCHVLGNIYDKHGNVVGVQQYTNESLAHDPQYGTKINLRIDAAISAIQSIITTASSVAATTKNIQFALYGMQLDPANNNQISTVATMSSNYSTLSTAAATIELGNNDGAGEGDSDFPNGLATFNNMLTSSGVKSNGNGASATSPLNFIFIVSDGLSDVNGTNHTTGAFNASNCYALKKLATVGTIYTTYSPIYQNNNPAGKQYNSDFVKLVQPYTMTNGDQLATGLLNCATDSTYAFQANDGPDIVKAMKSLFQRTQPSSARITQ